MTLVKEPHDRHVYPLVNFYRDTLEFYLAAVNFYESLLNDDLRIIETDEDLKTILGKRELESFPINEELNRTHRILEWLKEEINKGGEKAWFYTISLSHGMVRFIKSVGKLYIEHLILRRNALASRPKISKAVLEALDQKISALEENVQTGVFLNATPYPLLVEQLPEIETEEREILHDTAVPKADVRPRPVIIDSIEILNPELRKRCLDLFAQFREDGQHDRLDTVLNEATRILEDRLRSLSSAPLTCTGVELATYTFGQKPPRLVVSDVTGEQEAAHLLFRGVFGFVRNAVHHRLMGTIQPERVLQIVGMIDYLLFVAEGARREPIKA
jgi:hypothetical protein